MEVYRKSSWFFLLLGISFLATALQGVQGEVELEGPSESECRPYIERALKELETGDVNEATSSQQSDTSLEENLDVTNDNSNHQENGDGEQNDTNEKETGSIENIQIDTTQDEQSFEQIRETQEQQSEEQNEELTDTTDKQEEEITQESIETEETTENVASHESIVKENEGSIEDQPATTEETESVASAEQTIEGIPESTEESPIDKQENTEDSTSAEHLTTKPEDSQEQTNVEEDKTTTTEESEEQTTPTASVEDSATSGEEQPTKEEQGSSEEQSTRENVEEVTSNEEHSTKEVSTEEEQPTKENVEEQSAKEASSEEEQPTKENAGDTASSENQSTIENVSNEEGQIIKENLDEEPLSEEQPTKETSIEIASEEEQPAKENVEEASSETPSSEEQQIKGSLEDVSSDASTQTEQSDETKEENAESKETTDAESETTVIEEAVKNSEEGEEKVVEERAAEQEAKSVESVEESAEPVPEEDLTLEMEIPVDLRPRDHVEQLLKLDDDSKGTENIINKVSEITLKELKKLYENAIKPLEVLYKYRDLSNRHFGDAEIFSKPLILFMGPWSGGKSSIINYLTNNEYNETSLRTGAEPSPAYFNILMYGNEPEIIDGTELAADFTFSGLQKFGQGLEERLRGVRLPTKLLEKVNIVEIPGILEVRKQVSRVFPFNDACQWFIDRADIIFLVYDPSKLDVGPETEAILDQLKGREHQTRIILNKADQVKPEELMRVQGALIWNISPLMSSPQPPIMYTTSLWSRPYEFWAPTRLLQAQERAFLRDLRGAVDKRIENKIASARRFAVRVRNHAKMVDCYLTTYYNHKSVFGNRKQVADEIIEHPQDYHIYEGLSTLTNISRYDLPDPEVYKDFFKLNPLYDFQQLSATCTYFRGCPINRLDVAIAYDLPELVGTHRRLVENALAEANLASAPPGS